MGHSINWKSVGQFLLGISILIAISFILAFLLNKFFDSLNLPLDRYLWLTLIIVSLTSLVANLTIVAPVPIGLSFMFAAATIWNPALIGLAGAIGGACGEMSGYLAGYYGRRITSLENNAWYGRIEGWVNRYGTWAIFFLALQPLLPFDVGGLVAGAARMHIVKFWPALFAGKLIKYIVLAYAAAGVINFLPQWFGQT